MYYHAKISVEDGTKKISIELFSSTHKLGMAGKLLLGMTFSNACSKDYIFEKISSDETFPPTSLDKIFPEATLISDEDSSNYDTD